MSNLFPEEEIESLRRELERHNRLYYVEAKPEITDREYDALMTKLIALETAHPEFYSADSPSLKVGGAPIEGFQQVTHRVPMLSIENVFYRTNDEVPPEKQKNTPTLEKWDASLREDLARSAVDYTVEYKIDGVAMALVWEKGNFASAATRGNGTEGDDVTLNAKLITGVPWQLLSDHPPASLEVRGEVVILNEEFSAFQAAQVRASEDPFMNPRNAAAGILKLLDQNKRGRVRMLRFVAHGIGFIDGVSWNSYREFLSSIQAFGIPTTPNVSHARGFDHLTQVCDSMIAKVSELPDQVDGLVIKIDSLNDREQLGTTSKSPRWVRAYKWERYEAETHIRAIVIEVGKTGALTPVAELEPVDIAGTTVSNASLHNRDEVVRLGVRIGDLVVIEKAGKIIPHILRVNESARSGREESFEFPTKCPECDASVYQDEGGVYIRCTNPKCPAQLRETLNFFASRPAMNIDGLGETLIEKLLQKGFVNGIPSLYRLEERKPELVGLKGQGETSIGNMFDGLMKSKKQPVWRLLTGLNIRHVGQTTARTLEREFGTLDEVAAQTIESLSKTTDIGPVVAKSVYEFFKSDYGAGLMKELAELGLNYGIKKEQTDDTSGKMLSGKVFVVTGTLPTLSRDVAEELIRQHGGKPTGSVSKKTDFVLAGDAAGSKLNKALELGIPVISEQDFRSMIEP